MPLKIDLHVHTCYSGDSSITLEQLIKQLRQKGLDGAAITDHDTIEGVKKILKNNISGLLIIPGIEISTRRGHILAINVTETIPSGLSAEETIEKIHEASGIAIAAHPQAFFKNGLGLNHRILNLGLDAIEVVNSSVFPFIPLTYLAKKFAERNNIPQTAGSDSHMPETIGLAYTFINNDKKYIDNIIEDIRRGLATPVGRGIPSTLRIKRILKSVL